MMGQKPGMGGATGAQGNPGNTVSAIMKVRNAVELLEQALPHIPMGSPLHTKALKIIKEIVEAIPQQEGGMAGPQQTNLLQLLRSNEQSAPQAMLARLSGQPGGQPPAMPQQQAA